MVQTIDQDQLLEEQRKGINQYYFTQVTYKTPSVSARDSRSSGSSVRSGFETSELSDRDKFENPGLVRGPQYAGTRHLYPKMTAEEAKAFGADPNVQQHGIRKPGNVLNQYFGTNEDPNKGSEGLGGFSFEMPEYTIPTFEDIYGMSEEEWQFEQQRKGDLAQFEPAWAAREAAQTSATSAIDQLIREQESYGALTGQDIRYTGSQRSTMISNMFADMFGEGQEAYIDEIVGKYGLGADYTKGVKRGKIGQFGADRSIANLNRGAGRSGIASTVLTDEEILGSDAILG